MKASRLLVALSLVAAVAGACGKKQRHADVRRVPAATPEPSPTPEATPVPTAVVSGGEAQVTPTPRFGVVGRIVDDTKKDVGKVIDDLAKTRKNALRAVDEIGEADERALGQASAIEIIAEHGGLLLQDEELLRYVNRVGNAVAQQGSRKVRTTDDQPKARSRDFVFGVLDEPAVMNAYATPGGYVFVTSGLLESLGSESELAWVLAHEIAHVDLEHGLTALKTYIRESTWMRELGLSGSQRTWQDPGFFGSMAAASAQISLKVHGRREERAADKLGLEYAVGAGYDAHGVRRVMEMMAASGETRLSPFVSHDPAWHRWLELEKAVEALSSKRGTIGASRFTSECIDRLDAIRIAKQG